MSVTATWDAGTPTAAAMPAVTAVFAEALVMKAVTLPTASVMLPNTVVGPAVVVVAAAVVVVLASLDPEEEHGQLAIPNVTLATRPANIVLVISGMAAVTASGSL